MPQHNHSVRKLARGTAVFILRCGPRRDHDLLVSQRHHGIHAHRTPRGNVAGDEGNRS